MDLYTLTMQLEELLQEVSNEIPKTKRGFKAAAKRLRAATIRLEKFMKLYRKKSYEIIKNTK